MVFLLGAFVGATVGFFTAALMAASGRASESEEQQQRSEKAEAMLEEAVRILAQDDSEVWSKVCPGAAHLGHCTLVSCDRCWRGALSELARQHRQV